MHTDRVKKKERKRKKRALDLKELQLRGSRVNHRLSVGSPGIKVSIFAFIFKKVPDIPSGYFSFLSATVNS